MARKTGSHSEITGPRIQEAALRLFARHGFAAVSMRQIAGAVGVQVGALYRYIPDKQSLLFGLMQDHMNDLMAAWISENPPATPRQQLRHFTQFHIHYHFDRPDAVFVSYMELRNLSQDNFAVIEGLRGQYEDMLEAILVRGVDVGDFVVVDTKIATLAIIAMLTGVITWYRQGGRLSREKVAEFYWDMVRRAVCAQDVNPDKSS